MGEALRHNEAFVAFRQRLPDAGKAKMLTVGADMRKLVHVIYGVPESGRPFNAKWAMGGLTVNTVSYPRLIPRFRNFSVLF